VDGFSARGAVPAVLPAGRPRLVNKRIDSEIFRTCSAELPGVLELSAQEWAAIGAELAPIYLAVAHRLLRRV